MTASDSPTDDVLADVLAEAQRIGFLGERTGRVPARSEPAQRPWGLDQPMWKLC